MRKYEKHTNKNESANNMYYHSYGESGKTNNMSTSVDYFGSIDPLSLNYNLNSPYNINELHRRQVRRKSIQNIGM